ncbi:MAG TPA: hypothetical protein VHO25_07755 [Polyangiaceae bacterium]|nr:hypothetical protein [Polyangiaceae bacterium]
MKVHASSGGGVDRDGRTWSMSEDGRTWECFDGISASEAKRAFALRQNVEAFTEHYRHECCGLLTLTAREADLPPKEFARIWHRMTRRDLAWVRSYVRVLEAQRRGSPHYHLLVATPFDLAPGQFDWEALKGAAEAYKRRDVAQGRALTKRYAQSATEDLRGIWSELREVCEHYGMGRSEMLPFRKEAGAVANYVGKYLEGGLSYRRDEWKGARRVEYERREAPAWKRCGSSFAWLSSGATAWRMRVRELAGAVGARSLSDLRVKLGRRWAYHWRPVIMTATPEEWTELVLHWMQVSGSTCLFPEDAGQ